MAQEHSLDGVCLQLQGGEELNVKGIRPPAVQQQGDAVDLQHVAQGHVVAGTIDGGE